MIPFRGVRGWLRFIVVIWIYISPAANILLLLLPVDTTVGTLVWSLASMYLTAFQVRAGVALRGLETGAVRMAKMFLWQYVVIGLTLSLVVPVILRPGTWSLSSRALVSSAETIMAFCIWYAYFSVSKRVKATYRDVQGREWDEPANLAQPG